jgi:hypothetical protein
MLTSPQVFVTFNKESEQRSCLAAMAAGKWSCFTNPATVFRSKVSASHSFLS